MHIFWSAKNTLRNYNEANYMRSYKYTILNKMQI